MYILGVASRILAIISKKQRVHFFILLLFFLFSASLQIVGVASIAPFITILSNQEIIQSNEILNYLYTASGANSTLEFIVGFAVVSLLMIVVSNFMSAITFWLLLKYSVLVGGDIQLRLYNNFLARNYLFHKTKNYNRIIAIISQEAPRFVYMVLQQFLIFLSQFFVAGLILIGLVMLDPAIAAASMLIIGGSYVATYVIVKKSLIHHGKVMTERNEGIQATLSESFIGIKEIKLGSLEKKYGDKFSVVNFRGLNSAAYISLSGDLPRFVIETISFGAVLILAVILLMASSSSEGIISILSIYALAGYKLLPTMQQMYKSVSSMSANGSVVYTLLEEISTPVTTAELASTLVIEKVDKLELVGIHYSYPGAATEALKDINLSFVRGHLNTIAGPSGSGKSTLSDVILGLLPADSGTIKIDGIALTDEVARSYRASIGYVPQSIFILDADILSNVAFGVPEQEIDIDKVHEALKMANATEFVDRLPNGIHTQLGQDGKLLSGGQRQRIGIARALYRNSSVLILDEPTSALDIESEYELMTLLGKLKERVLIIIISHRPAAIKLSDTITLMNNGQIVASASYQELRESNPEFREILEKGMME